MFGTFNDPMSQSRQKGHQGISAFLLEIGRHIISPILTAHFITVNKQPHLGTFSHLFHRRHNPFEHAVQMIIQSCRIELIAFQSC